MDDISQISHLKIRGVSQLEKEIKETKNVKNKIIDKVAIHRNEETNEMEHYDNHSYEIQSQSNSKSTNRLLAAQKNQRINFANINYADQFVDEIIAKHVDATELI